MHALLSLQLNDIVVHLNASYHRDQNYHHGFQCGLQHLAILLSNQQQVAHSYDQIQMSSLSQDLQHYAHIRLMQFASLNKYRGKAHCFHVRILRSKFCLLRHDSQSRLVLKYHLRLLIRQCLWFQHLESQCIWYAHLNGFLNLRVLRLHSLIYKHLVIQYIYLPYR